jgi:CBS domain-containing protein
MPRANSSFVKVTQVASSSSLKVALLGSTGTKTRQPPQCSSQGDHFGEEALLSRDGTGVHTLSVRAETPLDLITVCRDDFARLSESLGVLRQDIQQSLAVHKGHEGLMALVQDDPRLASIRVAQVMSSPAETLSPHHTLAEVVERFQGGKLGYAVVAEDGRILLANPNIIVYIVLKRN